MFETELDNLLHKQWSDEERAMITRLMENVTYYKKLIPKSLKQDIMNALQMCNVLKDELEYCREICKCKIKTENENSNQEYEKECNCKEDCKCEGCKCEGCKCEECKCEGCKCEECKCEECKCEEGCKCK